MSIVKKIGLLGLCLVPSLAVADQIHLTNVYFNKPPKIDLRVTVTAGKMNGSTCTPNHFAFSVNQVVTTNIYFKMDGGYLFSKLHNDTYAPPDYTCVRETYSDNNSEKVLGEANYNLTGANTVSYLGTNPSSAAFTVVIQ